MPPDPEWGALALQTQQWMWDNGFPEKTEEARVCFWDNVDIAFIDSSSDPLWSVCKGIAEDAIACARMLDYHSIVVVGLHTIFKGMDHWEPEYWMAYVLLHEYNHVRLGCLNSGDVDGEHEDASWSQVHEYRKKFSEIYQ